MRSKASLLALCTALAVPAEALSSDDDETEGHDFLFLIEEAYTQEKGEIQVDGAFARSPISDGGWDLGLAFEYGLTDRLQVEIGLPFALSSTADNEAGIRDIELELAYGLVQENDQVPQVTVSFGGILPTGKEEDGLGAGGLGIETGLSLSKQIADIVTLFLDGGFEYVPDGRDESGDSLDLREWSFGAGAAVPLHKDITALVEYSWEREREETPSEVEREREAFVSLGLSAELNEVLEIGGAYVIGASREAADHGVIVKLQAEW